MRKYTREEVEHELKNTIAEVLECRPESITPESRLREDLDIDSIDAVEIVVKMQKLTERRFKPEDYQQIRTVKDVVDLTLRVANDPGYGSDL